MDKNKILAVISEELVLDPIEAIEVIGYEDFLIYLSKRVEIDDIYLKTTFFAKLIQLISELNLDISNTTNRAHIFHSLVDLPLSNKEFRSFNSIFKDFYLNLENPTEYLLKAKWRLSSIKNKLTKLKINQKI